MLELLRALFGEKAPEVRPQEAYQRHAAENESTLILDVRQPPEYGWGTIAGAKRIPLTQLGKRIEELPRDAKILTICQSSHRSPIAARMLRRAGFDVMNVEGGMSAWDEAGLPLQREPN